MQQLSVYSSKKSFKKFLKKETLSSGKLIEEQNSIYDGDFWKNYNIMLPTSDFNKIASKLEANNKANDIKIEIEEQLNDLPKDKSIRIDSILSFYNHKDLFNGTVLITSEGKTILQKSYNNAITDNKLNSQFRIGSLSKTFTSMIIAQLENENKLKYDDSISEFLPNYKNGDINSKRSTKNFNTNQEAVIYMSGTGKGIGAVKTVPGQVTACKYCPAFTACTQKDNLIAAGDLIISEGIK